MTLPMRTAFCVAQSARPKQHTADLWSAVSIKKQRTDSNRRPPGYEPDAIATSRPTSAASRRCTHLPLCPIEDQLDGVSLCVDKRDPFDQLLRPDWHSRDDDGWLIQFEPRGCLI